VDRQFSAENRADLRHRAGGMCAVRSRIETHRADGQGSRATRLPPSWTDSFPRKTARIFDIGPVGCAPVAVGWWTATTNRPPTRRKAIRQNARRFRAGYPPGSAPRVATHPLGWLCRIANRNHLSHNVSRRRRLRVTTIGNIRTLRRSGMTAVDVFDRGCAHRAAEALEPNVFRGGVLSVG
jgi:hypothetical protein